MTISTNTTVYGKVIPQPIKSISVSQTEKLVGFGYPFSTTPLRGYFSAKSGQNLIKSMISTLIRTEQGERFMLPNYGCNVRKFLMEPLDKTTFDDIKKEIEQSVKNYLKNISLDKIQIFNTGGSTTFGNAISVKLFLTVKGSNESLDIGVKVS